MWEAAAAHSSSSETGEGAKFTRETHRTVALSKFHTKKTRKLEFCPKVFSWKMPIFRGPPCTTENCCNFNFHESTYENRYFSKKFDFLKFPRKTRSMLKTASQKRIRKDMSRRQCMWNRGGGGMQNTCNFSTRNRLPSSGHNFFSFYLYFAFLGSLESCSSKD